MAKIIVVGSFVMDMVARVTEFPLAGQTILGNSLNVYPGGKGANQCVAAARMGVKTRMIGMVGDDAYGKTFIDLLKNEGVDCDNIYVTDKVPTAVAQIQINDAAENKIVVIPSANFQFSLDDLKRSEQALKGDIVITQMEQTPEVTSEVIRTCHRLGVPVMLNPAPARHIDDDVLKLVTYLTPNETELEILSGIATDTDEHVKQAAQKLLDLGVGNIIATLGKRGALIAAKNSMEIVGGYKVKVTDTVAAGDSFNGALAAALTEGKTLGDAVRFANAVGALTVTKSGAIPSLPYRNQVEEFIKAYR